MKSLRISPQLRLPVDVAGEAIAILAKRGAGKVLVEEMHAAGASPTSSSFSNNLGSLRSLGLIGYPSPGMVAALPILFLE